MYITKKYSPKLNHPTLNLYHPNLTNLRSKGKKLNCQAQFFRKKNPSPRSDLLVNYKTTLMILVLLGVLAHSDDRLILNRLDMNIPGDSYVLLEVPSFQSKSDLPPHAMILDCNSLHCDLLSFAISVSLPSSELVLDLLLYSPRFPMSKAHPLSCTHRIRQKTFEFPSFSSSSNSVG